MIDITKPVKRKVLTLAHTPLVVAMAPEGIWLRERGRRTAYLLPYGQALLEAVRLHIYAEKRRKTSERKQRAAARKAARS
jgi:hypothetical protein